MPLLLTPTQSQWVLGTELTSLAVVGGLILTIAERDKQTSSNEEELPPVARLLARSSPNLPPPLFALVAGVTLLAGHDGGLWPVPAVVFALVGGILNAWWSSSGLRVDLTSSGGNS